MKVNTLKLVIYSLIILCNSSSVLRAMNYGEYCQKKDGDIPLLSRQDIKGVTNVLDIVNTKTLKAVVYGGLLSTSPILWDTVAILMTNAFSPLATVSYYATNPTTAVLVPLLLNPFIDYVIKPLPNNLHNQNWPNEALWLKKIFLKEYRSIKQPGEKFYCSRFALNPEEYVENEYIGASDGLRAMKKSTVNALWLRGKYRLTHNPIASAIIGFQILLTLYAAVCSVRSKSLNNSTKSLTIFACVYATIGQLHELSNIKYFTKENV